MNPDAQRTNPFAELFRQWEAEHDQLDQFLTDIRRWTYDVAQLGVPRFGEAAEKLTVFRDRLLAHFHRETELGLQLAGHPTVSSPEIEKACRQAEHDHHNLKTRLDDLIHRLNQLEPPYSSWQQAVDELDLFIDALEQHEEQENESMHWLAPNQPDTND